MGEIMVKEDVSMLGYLNRPEEDAKFWGRDGFWHTGDSGHYDDEGILYFDSRIKDMLKVSAVQWELPESGRRKGAEKAFQRGTDAIIL